ncbi:hypothetical protein Emag_006979 [Eimeria magna]
MRSSNTPPEEDCKGFDISCLLQSCAPAASSPACEAEPVGRWAAALVKDRPSVCLLQNREAPMRPLGPPLHTPQQPPTAWGPPPVYRSGGLHAQGGRGGAGYFGGPRGGQQGTRGGRRGAPHRYNRQSDSLCNLPIPPGALCDPWAPLSAQRGGPLPLEAPTDEVLQELKAEVARQVQLQRLIRQGEEAPAHNGGPSSCGEGAPLSAEGCSELKEEGPSEEDEEAGGSGADESPSPEGGPRLKEDSHTGDGGPSATSSTPGRGRPLVLPPPTFDTGAPEGPGWEGEASSSSHNSSTISSHNGSSSSSSSGPGAAFVSDGSSLSLPMGDGSMRGPRGFLLPAVSGGGPPEGAPGSTWLSLDEEGIRKKVRGAPSND